jgi:hypothetical protein
MSDGVSQISPDLAALIAVVTGLGTALKNNVEGLSGADTYDGQARASAQAALASKNSAATSQSTASSQATAAANSATSASGSASTANTKAGAAASSATAAGSSASAASTSATNAATYASNAQNYNNQVQAFKQIAPIAAAASVSGVASTTWNATCSFTPQSNGWVFAIGSWNLYQPPSSGYEANLLINGNNVGSDTTELNQKHMGFLYVTAGTAVTVQMQAISYTPAPLQGGSLHVVAWFLPAP